MIFASAPSLAVSTHFLSNPFGFTRRELRKAETFIKMKSEVSKTSHAYNPLPLLGIVPALFYCFLMSKKSNKSISKIEHVFHIVLTLATSGLWLVIYLARILLKRNKAQNPNNKSINQLSSNSANYVRRELRANKESDEDEWSEFMDPFSFQIVGESHYRENLLSIIESNNAHKLGELSVQAEIRKEPDNKFDENAVCVLINGKKVGHISKDYSFEVTTFLDERGLDSMLVNAVIGWNTNSPNPPIGVRLDFNF